MKRIGIVILACLSLISCSTAADGVLENQDIRLVFSKENGSLVSLYNVREGVEHLDPSLAAIQPLWEFDYMPGSEKHAVR